MSFPAIHRSSVPFLFLAMVFLGSCREHQGSSTTGSRGSASPASRSPAERSSARLRGRLSWRSFAQRMSPYSGSRSGEMLCSSSTRKNRGLGRRCSRNAENEPWISLRLRVVTRTRPLSVTTGGAGVRETGRTEPALYASREAGEIPRAIFSDHVVDWPRPSD